MLVSDLAHDSEEVGEFIYRFFENFVFTEEDTDRAIEFWLEYLPSSIKLWIFPIPLPKFMMRKFLDSMLPDKALELLRNYMAERGWLNLRRAHPNNPFS